MTHLLSCLTSKNVQKLTDADSAESAEMRDKKSERFHKFRSASGQCDDFR